MPSFRLRCLARSYTVRDSLEKRKEHYHFNSTEDQGWGMKALQHDLCDLPVGLIDVDPSQPRKTFDADKLQELASSIEDEGLLQPISVRKDGERYIIIAGERRFKAVCSLNLETIPAMVLSVEVDRADMLQMIENVVRVDLNPIEEARGYKALVDSGMSLEDIAAAVGTSKYQVQWRVEMLGASPAYLDLVEKGHMTPSVAWSAARVPPAVQQAALAKIVRGGLNHKQAVWCIEKIEADEAQTDLFLESPAPPERLDDYEIRSRERFRDWFADLTEMAGFLLQEELDRPGILASSLRHEPETATQKLGEIRRQLGRIELAVSEAMFKESL
jgi:ParB family chromosome partitioning protein